MIWTAHTMIAVALASCAAGAISGWTLNDWRLSARIEAERAEIASQAAAATHRARQIERAADQIRTQSEIDHATARDQIDRALADNRRLSRQLGGLRDPGQPPIPTCPVPNPADPASQPDPAAATAGLPAEDGRLLSAAATDFLLDLAAEADRAAAYATTCHEWALRIGAAAPR